jgi:flagellar basal-body rod protein FlgC
MDLFRAFNISASGLSAQRARIDVIAENLANSDTTVTAGGGPYRRKTVVLESTDGHSFPGFLREHDSRDAGVKVHRVLESGDAWRRLYEPGHPEAGPDGFVNFPNVNPLTEMVDMLSTTRAYEANVTAFQAAKAMGAKLLELLR